MSVRRFPFSLDENHGLSRARVTLAVISLCVLPATNAFAQTAAPVAPSGTRIAPAGAASSGSSAAAAPTSSPTPAPSTPPKGPNPAPPSGTNDILFLKNGSMMRGTIIDVIPGTRARIQLPTGEISTVKWSEIDHVAYAGQTVQGGAATPAPTVSPSTSNATPIAKGRIRLKAICGDSPKILGGMAELVVEEITDTKDISLSPATNAYPDYKYDEATHERKLVDPEFVEYELDGGPHRLRVHAKHCNANEQVVTVGAGQTVDVAAKLEREIIPLIDVRFERPAFAQANDEFEIKNDAGALCKTLPCAAKVPAKEGAYSLYWKRANGELVVSRVPDPGNAVGKTLVGETVEKKNMSIPAIGFMATGGAILAIGLLAFAGDGNRGQCTYSASNGSITYKTDYFSGCPSSPFPSSVGSSDSQSFSGSGAGELVAIGIGAVTTAVGIIFYALDVGSKEQLFVNIGQTSTPTVTHAASVKFQISAGGLGGTF